MKIVIADDHQLMLAGVRQALDRDGGFEIVAEAHHGAQVMPMVGSSRPEVVLLDLRMPGLDGLTCLDQLRDRHPAVGVVIFSAADDPTLIQSAFKGGACGYIVKSVDFRDLGSAIRQSIDGNAYHALGLPAMSDDTAAGEAGLTSRELEVTRLLKLGLSNKAIAKELWVTEQTVKFHLTRIYAKLGVANRTEAARWAFSHGLQDPKYQDPNNSPVAIRPLNTAQPRRANV